VSLEVSLHWPPASSAGQRLAPSKIRWTRNADALTGRSLVFRKWSWGELSHYKASWACTMNWCSAGVVARFEFAMMLANSAWILARWLCRNRFTPPAIFR